MLKKGNKSKITDCKLQITNCFKNLKLFNAILFIIYFLFFVFCFFNFIFSQLTENNNFPVPPSQYLIIQTNPKVLLSGKDISKFVLFENGETFIGANEAAKYFIFSAKVNGKEIIFSLSDGNIVKFYLGEKIATGFNKKFFLKQAPKTKNYQINKKTFTQNLIPLEDLAKVLDYFIFIDNSGNINIIPKVKSIDFEKNQEGMQIIIKASGQLNIKQDFLSNPSRIILDLSPAFLAVNKKDIEVEESYLKKIRYSQFQVKPEFTSRIVLDVLRAVTPVKQTSNDGRTIKFFLPHQIVGVGWAQKEKKNKVFIKTSGPIAYKTFYLKNPQRLVFDFSPAILFLNEGEKKGREIIIPIETDDIQQVRLAQNNINPDIVRLVFDLKNKVNFQIASAQILNTTAREYMVEVLPYITPFYGIKIMVDAGHGGQDPGAKSIHGYQEKDINLDVATKLYNLLTQAGVESYLMRSNDTFVPLYDRPKITNNLGVDLFVSIHSNALPQKSVKRGSEVWYYKDDSLEFAKVVLGEIIKETGMPNSGIHTNSFVVVKYTTMPSILVEMGYLTNPTDELLLTNESFRQKMAQGIFNGIKLYLETRQGLISSGKEPPKVKNKKLFEDDNTKYLEDKKKENKETLPKIKGLEEIPKP